MATLQNNYIISLSARAFSNILLKAPLFVTPIDKCNASFVDYGLTRQIQDGIIDTQLCAEDKDLIKDACQGDSGGPLVLVVDGKKEREKERYLK